MYPLLTDGNIVLLNKIGVGIKIPSKTFGLSKNYKTLEYIQITPNIKNFSCNDILILKSSNNYTIKRLVGLPGDTISIFNSSFILNNQCSKLENNDTIATNIESYPLLSFFAKGFCGYENAFNVKNILIPKNNLALKISSDNLNLYKDILVKYEGLEKLPSEEFFHRFNHNYYFLVGDNRMNSIDSRQIGFIPEFKIVGIATKLF